ncbi:cold-shock protein [Loigolactobacillus iwatensis]|uniref:cold-shock protein n=1 Tax=Loigolactobacillus iwatensis TaxID=1267156 RepID=UPI000F7DBEFA|nr:cold shock domain-containing protein [Loigolactobacillus iwatensis]
MQRGTVEWFSSQKGYGFISYGDNDDEIFVHFTAIVADGFKTLSPGDAVEFEIKEGARGLQAANVKKQTNE